MLNVAVDGVVFENRHQIGIWRYHYEVMRRLDPRVRCTLWLRSDPIQECPAEVLVRRDVARKWFPPWDLLGQARRLRDCLTTPAWLNSADVFHSTFFTRCPVRGPAVVVTVHDMIPERLVSICGSWARWQIARKKALIRAATICITISAATAEDLKTFYPEVADRIRVIHLGAEHLFGAARPADCDRSGGASDPFALYVGLRREYKNFSLLLEAMRHRSWPRDLHLHVVGPPWDESERKTIEDFGLRDRIRALGRVSDAELRSEYAGACCVVVPSLLEGFGLPVLEAQANGCPAVLSDISVFHEVAGEAALFFDPRLGERLAEAVALAREPGVRRRLVAAGGENVRRFSWDRTAEQTCAAYEEARRMAP
jgi:glycosyltransferase involved in cell wall biosynthesis